MQYIVEFELIVNFKRGEADSSATKMRGAQTRLTANCKRLHRKWFDRSFKRNNVAVDSFSNTTYER